MTTPRDVARMHAEGMAPQEIAGRCGDVTTAEVAECLRNLGIPARLPDEEHAEA